MSTVRKSIPIHAQGKIDIHNRRAHYLASLEKFTHKPGVIEANRRLILAFLHDCMLGKTVLKRSKKRLGPARCNKYLNIMERLSAEFGKPFDEVTQSDMEHIIIALDSDTLRRRNGQPYRPETKCDYRRTIKKFWKWKDGNNRQYPELVEWIETETPMQDIPALTRDEVERMIEHTPGVREKALLMVLFDSGARAEELLNVRLKPEHILFSRDIGCYKMRIEFSKTKPRTISLPLSTRHLKRWLEMHPGKGNEDAQLFPINYANMRAIVHRIGKRILGKTVSPHLLRHSSATYYANRLPNRFKLCYRYGWAMSSKQVDRYIDRAGIMEEETAQAVQNDEAIKKAMETNALREELVLLREEKKTLAVQFEEMTQQLADLKDGRGVMTLLIETLSSSNKGREIVELVERDQNGVDQFGVKKSSMLESDVK